MPTMTYQEASALLNRIDCSADDDARVDQIDAEMRRLYEENTALKIRDLSHALRRAEAFIANGVELGFIRMPDANVPDPAHETPLIIKKSIIDADNFTRNFNLTRKLS